MKKIPLSTIEFVKSEIIALAESNEKRAVENVQNPHIFTSAANSYRIAAKMLDVLMDTAIELDPVNNIEYEKGFA